MEELWRLYASKLRDRAEHCRKLAREARSEGIARELESIAQDYANDADSLERLSNPQRTLVELYLTPVV